MAVLWLLLSLQAQADLSDGRDRAGRDLDHHLPVGQILPAESETIARG